MTWLATKDGSATTVSTVMILAPRSAICFKGRVTPFASAGEMIVIVGCRAVTASTIGACDSPVKWSGAKRSTCSPSFFAASSAPQASASSNGLPLTPRIKAIEGSAA